MKISRAKGRKGVEIVFICKKGREGQSREKRKNRTGNKEYDMMTKVGTEIFFFLVSFKIHLSH